MSKKSLIIYSLVTVLAMGVAFNIPVPPANAVTATGPTTFMQKTEARASIAAQRNSEMLSRIIQRADQLIATRLGSLQKLLTRIQGDKRLSDADKTNLTNDIQTTVGNLQTLKTKIDADTDEATARADAKSIVTNFRIYAIYEPKVRLITTISNLQTSSSNVSSVSARIQTLLNNLKAQGKDTTAAQAALNDVNTQLTAINTLLSADRTLVSNVNTNTSDPQSIFVQVRKDLATVRADFAKIRSDIATIRATLKLVVKLSPAAASNSAK